MENRWLAGRDASPLSRMALTALGAKGSILLDQYISEFGDPWQLTLPYDDFHGAYEPCDGYAPRFV